jgi:hypothetical protein
MLNASELKRLEGHGINVPSYATILPENWRDDPFAFAPPGHNGGPRMGMGMDAQPALVTSENVGIPAYMANLLDPKSIRVLVQPMKAVMLYGEVKKGDWTTLTTQFPVVESTGLTSSYNDYSNSGSVGSNYNWVPRQSYHFQVVTQYGDREVEMWGLAQINYVADLSYSANLTLMKFANQAYLFGINTTGTSLGLANFGGTNDPSLIAPIAPSAKAASPGGTGTSWNFAIAVEVYNDFLSLYQQLQVQLPGLVDRETPMTMGISPESEPNLGKVTEFTLAPVRDAIKSQFPNLKIVTVPEFNTPSGGLVQLIVDELEGDKTAYCAFTEKMRTGRLVPDTSWYRQKRISGTWGTIIRRPVAIAQMLGV